MRQLIPLGRFSFLVPSRFCLFLLFHRFFELHREHAFDCGRLNALVDAFLSQERIKALCDVRVPGFAGLRHFSTSLIRAREVARLVVAERKRFAAVASADEVSRGDLRSRITLFGIFLFRRTNRRPKSSSKTTVLRVVLTLQVRAAWPVFI